MKRFRLKVGLLIAGIIFFTVPGVVLFVKGLWASGCLCFIPVIGCIMAVCQLQSRLISTMSSFVSALEMNDTTFRIDADGDSEMRRMADAMNRIAELYRDNMKELQTRKLYYDRVLKIVTHEMRNGITPIAGISADMLQHPERYQGATLKEASGLLHSQAEGIRRFLDSYYNLTHIPEPKFEEVRAGDYFRSLQKIFNAELERRGLPLETVSYTVPEDMMLRIDPQLMNQVMTNLLRNSLDAIPAVGGAVSVTLSVSESRPYLTLSDNGSGIQQNVMDSLFTPFYTTKPNGSGVGLAVCRQIILKHGGTFRIQSQTDKGTSAKITL